MSTDLNPRQSRTTAFPIVKFGARWVCDGPDGRFHARTKAEAERLLAEALDNDAGFLIHAESTNCAHEPCADHEAEELRQLARRALGWKP